MFTIEKIRNRIAEMSEGTTFKYSDLNLTKSEYFSATKAIQRLIDSELIKRVSKGVFYKPEQSIFGNLLPSESEILNPYLFDRGKRIAYITGNSLYNKMGLTTQVPNNIQVASKEKRVTAQFRNMRVKPAKSYVPVTEDNYKFLQLLDAIKDFKIIPDMDRKTAINILKNELSKIDEKLKNELINYSLKYPPRTRALLGAILEDLDNQRYAQIEFSLNPLTTYKIGLSESILPTISNWNIQ